jgi:hypothetical protein
VGSSLAIEAAQAKAKQKVLIVLEGLKGRRIGELCAEHDMRSAGRSIPVAWAVSRQPSGASAGLRPERQVVECSRGRGCVDLAALGMSKDFARE